MKGLFAEEIEAEVSALQDADIHISSIEQKEPPAEKTRTQELPEDGGATVAERAAAGRKRQRIWLGAWAIAMAVIAMVLAIFFQERSLHLVILSAGNLN